MKLKYAWWSQFYLSLKMTTVIQGNNDQFLRYFSYVLLILQFLNLKN